MFKVTRESGTEVYYDLDLISVLKVEHYEASTLTTEDGDEEVPETWGVYMYIDGIEFKEYLNAAAYYTFIVEFNSRMSDLDDLDEQDLPPKDLTDPYEGRSYADMGPYETTDEWLNRMNLEVEKAIAEDDSWKNQKYQDYRKRQRLDFPDDEKEYDDEEDLQQALLRQSIEENWDR